MLLLHSANERRGFTFIEILLALAIVGMVAGLGIFSYASYKARSCARFAAEQFVQDLRYAREQAMMRNCTVAVDFTMVDYRIGPIDRTLPGNPISIVIKTNELTKRYGPPLTMTPASGRFAFTYQGVRDDTVTNVAGNQVIFGTTPGIVRRITVLPTGFSLVEKE